MTVLVKKEWIRRGRTDRLSREKAGVNWIRFGQISLLLAVAFATALFYIGQNLQIIRMGYEIENLRKELAVLRNQNSYLAVEAASLQDLRFIERQAKVNLRMRLAEPGQVIYGCKTVEKSPDGKEKK